MDKCDYCGQAPMELLDTEGTQYCVRCYKKCNTCLMCVHGSKCEFETNPSPLPKQVQKTIRQGNMVAQTVIKNPDRIRELCQFSCPCFDEDFGCFKENGICGNYQEIEPPYKAQRLEELENENDDT